MASLDHFYQPENQPSGGRAAILEQRADAELRELATVLHARQNDPVVILLELHDRLRLLVDAAALERVFIAMRPMAHLVRRACSLPDHWHPEDWLRQQAAAVLGHRAAESFIIGSWMRDYQTSPLVHHVAAAAKKIVADSLPTGDT